MGKRFQDSNAFIIQVVLLICFACFQRTSSSDGGGDNFERDLVQKLLSDYDIAVRPSRNISAPLNVTFGLALTQIIDVDERNQILTTNCWLNQQWMDEGLKWDPAQYGGIKQIRIPAEKVWKPDIILYNNADSQYNLAILSTNVIVNSEGNLTWLSTAIFKSSCQINVEYFPFDEQNCTMKFASWTYDGFQLNLVIQTEDGDLSNYVTNGEWSLIAMNVKRTVVVYSCCDEPYPDITYMIILRRRPLFYVFNLILPCVLISGLALLSFYMPSDSGEKVTLGITTLLSMTVFLMVIGESMPPTSEKLPLIGLYYGVTISLVSFATGLSVVTLNIHHRGMRGRELPPYLRRFIFDYLAKFLLLKLEMPKRAYLYTAATAPGSRSGGAQSVAGSSTDWNVTKPSLLGRRLPAGDTWRIVYPDMPATPTNMSYCHCDAHQSLLNTTSWRDKARSNHRCNTRPTPEGGNLESLSLEVPKSSAARSSSDNNPFDDERFRPVVRVRGVPSSNLTIPLATLSGPTAGSTFRHSSRQHHRNVHHHSSFAMDDTFIDFKATHHHHRSAFEVSDDLLHGTAESVIGARLSESSGRGRGGTGSTGDDLSGSSDMPQWQRQLLFLLYRINETLEKNEDRMDDQERKDILKLEWQQAALVIDRLLLWIFVVATVAATFGILYMSPHTKLFTT